MAGLIGRVPNNSAFASFKVKEWMPWMTEAVVLHFSGFSTAELSVKYGKTKQHLNNLMNTSQATAIIMKLQQDAMTSAVTEMPSRITAAKSKALGRIEGFLDDDQLANDAPMASWQASLRTMEVLSKLETPGVVQNNTVNIQQNVVNNLAPEVIDRLRSTSGLEIKPQELIPHNYESPDVPIAALRERAEEVLGRGISSPENKSEDGPVVALERSASGWGDHTSDQHKLTQQPIRLVAPPQEI